MFYFQKFDMMTNPDYVNELKKDKTLLKIIFHMKNLEELNLNGQGIEDYFLKKFSNKISCQKKPMLPKLTTIKMKKCCKITNIGMKFLYCALVVRKDIKYVDI